MVSSRVLKRNPSAAAALAAGAAATPTAAAVVNEDRGDKIHHITQRYPGLESIDLQRRVFTDWRVGEPIQTDWLLKKRRTCLGALPNQQRTRYEHNNSP